MVGTPSQGGPQESSAKEGLEHYSIWPVPKQAPTRGKKQAMIASRAVKLCAEAARAARQCHSGQELFVD
jgi:hypothetical protein